VSGRHVASFGELAALKAKLLRLPEVAAKVAEKGAARLTQLAQEAFDAGQSVYGGAWQPGLHGDQLDLTESGTLKQKATRYVAEGTRIRASVAAVPYSKFHIKRGILPQRGKLPAAWDKEISRIAQEELEGALAK
jgi:hypothetical protein